MSISFSVRRPSGCVTRRPTAPRSRRASFRGQALPSRDLANFDLAVDLASTNAVTALTGQNIQTRTHALFAVSQILVLHERNFVHVSFRHGGLLSVAYAYVLHSTHTQPQIKNLWSMWMRRLAKRSAGSERSCDKFSCTRHAASWPSKHLYNACYKE
jgi:hypothetical protein